MLDRSATMASRQTQEEMPIIMETRTRRAVARNVKALRKQSGLTQGQLALKAGTAQTVISYVEKPDGKAPAIDTLDDIAQALKVPAWALMMDLDEVDPLVLARAGHVVNDYLGVREEGRKEIERVAAAERRYDTAPKPPPDTN
jgi:transcriptional regulator with XRE-family HTH domain